MNNNNNQALEAVKKLFLTTGVALFFVGLYCLVDPFSVEIFTGLEKESSRILGIALVIIGCIDIFVLPRLLERKTK